MEGKAGHTVNPDALENDNKSMNMGVIDMTAVLKRLKKDEKGFTLIELLAVIVILGIIAAIAIPLIGRVMDNSRDTSDLNTARQIRDAAKLYVTSEMNGNAGAGDRVIPIYGSATSPGLASEGFLENNLTLPSTGAAISGGNVTFTDNEFASISIDVANSATDVVFTADQLQ
ncbi:type II secretion system protein [Paenibacillus sp. D51F]